MRAVLPKTDNAGGSEPCGKGTCQVCDHLITRNTFTTKVCGEVFKIQSGPLNCNSEKVLYLLRCKICHDTPYLQLIIVKVNTDLSKRKTERTTEAFSFTIFKIAIDVLMIGKYLYFEKCETHKQLKERETFLQRKLKNILPTWPK